MSTYTSLIDWANKWAIPADALTDLAQSVIYAPEPDESVSHKTEAFSQSQVRLEAPHYGVWLYRNNVGAGKLDSGNFVRFGLGNDSTKLNKVFKSGDLIGAKKRLITADMVGTYVGQFFSRECKRPDWKWSGTPEEIAQLKWATIINSLGGDAKIVTGPGSFA